MNEEELLADRVEKYAGEVEEARRALREAGEELEDARSKLEAYRRAQAIAGAADLIHLIRSEITHFGLSVDDESINLRNGALDDLAVIILTKMATQGRVVETSHDFAGGNAIRCGRAYFTMHTCEGKAHSSTHSGHVE